MNLAELESDFCHPPLRASVASLEAHFSSSEGCALEPLRNPHHEPKVDAAARKRAALAAVLMPIVDRPSGPTLLLTRRHADISFGGHICFPGGRADPADGSAERTALRESEEEIGLDPRAVRIIGRLGDYVTHSGFRIQPVIGVIEPPVALRPRDGEVVEILELPLDTALDSRSYRLGRASWQEGRAHYFLEFEGVTVAGPTVSVLMGLYEELLCSHGSAV